MNDENNVKTNLIENSVAYKNLFFKTQKYLKYLIVNSPILLLHFILVNMYAYDFEFIIAIYISYLFMEIF